jgi:hypothetical protein
MRRNHSHDRDQLDKIERRLAEGQPTGFEVVDDLADTVPRADPRFMDELEARLMIRFQSRGVEEEREEKPMQTIGVLPKTERLPRPVFKPSLTLLAAILVMVMVGAVLLLINNGPQPDAELGAGIPAQDSTATPTPTHTHTPLTSDQMTFNAIIAGMTATIEAIGTPTPIVVTLAPSLATPTPIPSATMTASPIMPTVIPPGNETNEGQLVTPTLVPTREVLYQSGFYVPSTLTIVIIAARDLPAGTMITPNDLVVTYWPDGSVPGGVYRNLFDAVNNIIDHQTTRDIPRWQPIFMDDVE